MKLIIVLLVGTLAAHSSPQDKQDEVIKKLVEQLVCEDVEARNQVQQELVKIGKPALEALRRLHTDSKDENVKAKAAETIDRIEYAKAYERLEKYKEYLQKEQGFTGEIRIEEMPNGSSKFIPDSKVLKISTVAEDSSVSLLHYVIVRKFRPGFTKITPGFSFAELGNFIKLDEIILSSEEEAAKFVDSIQGGLFNSTNLVQRVEKHEEKFQQEQGEVVLTAWKVVLFSDEAVFLWTDSKGKLYKITQ